MEIEIEGELIYVGEGTSDEDYEDKDVEGKIVLADGWARSVYRLAVERYGAIGILTDLAESERVLHNLGSMRLNSFWKRISRHHNIIHGW